MAQREKSNSSPREKLFVEKSEVSPCYPFYLLHDNHVSTEGQHHLCPLLFEKQPFLAEGPRPWTTADHSVGEGKLHAGGKAASQKESCSWVGELHLRSVATARRFLHHFSCFSFFVPRKKQRDRVHATSQRALTLLVTLFLADCRCVACIAVLLSTPPSFSAFGCAAASYSMLVAPLMRAVQYL